jgi:hypothetical protein
MPLCEKLAAGCSEAPEQQARNAWQSILKHNGRALKNNLKQRTQM